MSKRLLILIGIMAVLVAAAFFSTRSDEDNNGGQANALIFPELQQHLNDIHRIDIAQGKSSFSIVRGKDDVWRVKDKANYPADRDRVRALISTYASTYLLEKRTAKKENYKALGLDDAFMRRIAFYGDDNDKPMAALYVGLQKAARNATFVRRPGEDQTWLAHFNLAADAAAEGWLDKSLMAILDSNIKSIIISHGNAPTVNVYREKQGGDIRLEGLPAGKELKDPRSLTNLFNLFMPLELEDVRAASELRASSLETTQVTLFDGRKITLRFNQDGDDKWTTIEADYQPADAQPDTKAKKDKNSVDPEIFTKNLSKRTDGYAFKLPYNVMTKLNDNIKDLVK